MFINVSDMVTLLTRVIDPRDCCGELTVKVKYNLLGTDMFPDVATISLSVKVDNDGLAEFAEPTVKSRWAIDQLDKAGYYIADVSDVISTGRDFAIVYISHD